MTDSIETLLEHACTAGEFSGAAWTCGTADGIASSGTIGTVRAGGPATTRDTWWDLASVTKPLVALAVLSLVESEQLGLDDAIARYVPGLSADKTSITVRELLTHTSGLPGNIAFYRWCATRTDVVDAVLRAELRFAPGSDVEYSSAGFIVLGLLAERASGCPLHELVRDRVCLPIGLTSTRFGVPVGRRSEAAATEQCAWRNQLVQGTVHDENAALLGGVAGHAGLFSTLADLEQLAIHLCRLGRGESGVLAAATWAIMTAPATDGLRLRRCLGWQGRDARDCPAGHRVGPRSFGHTGFTGTSIWFDPDGDSYAVLLTNRVHPSRMERDFPRVRAQFHHLAADFTREWPV